VRPIVFHPKARDEIRRFPKEARNRLGRGLFRLQMGEALGMPNARPIPAVAPGVSECGIVAGHPGVPRLQKKTQKTPASEIERARKRLKELLDE
jgi:phage-related protein